MYYCRGGVQTKEHLVVVVGLRESGRDMGRQMCVSLLL